MDNDEMQKKQLDLQSRLDKLFIEVDRLVKENARIRAENEHLHNELILTKRDSHTTVYTNPIDAWWRDGKTLQVRLKDAKDQWMDYTGTTPDFTNPAWEWRVKPQ